MPKYFLPALLVLMGMASSASGLDIAATARIGATVSDNINRYPSGFEESGSLLTQGVGIRVSGEEQRRSFLLSLDGGWETLESKSESSSEQIYRIDGSFNLPLTRTGRLEGTVGATRGTVTPDEDDPDQGRTLSKETRAGLLVGNDISVVSRWEAGVDARWEDREDLELEETSGRVQWWRDLSRIRTFSVEMSGLDGSDEFERTSWQGLSAALDLTERLSTSSSRTFRLDWEEMVLEEEDGSETTSWMVGLEAGYESQSGSGWSHEGSIGISRFDSSSGEETWEPSGSFSVEKNLSRTTVAEAGVDLRTRMRDPRDDEVEWIRQGRLTAGLMWTLSRKFSVGPRVSYLHEDITGREVPDREDQTLIARVDARWTPYTTWLMEFGVVVEKQESTDPAEELTENRVEIRASSLFQ